MATNMIPPGDIEVTPARKLVFNAPFEVPDSQSIKITNKGNHRIGWRIGVTNSQRYGVKPFRGVLCPGDSVTVEISRKPFDEMRDEFGKEKILIDWTNTPHGAPPGECSPAWFYEKNSKVRHKIFPMAFNS